MLLIVGTFFGLACLTRLTMAYPTGMPESACEDMMPNHGASPQTSDPPFMIEIKIGTITKDMDSILYGIKSKGNMTFKGFTIYSDQDGKPIPYVFPSKTGEIQKQCKGEDNVTYWAGTHVDAEPKTEIEGIWWGPNITLLKSSAPIFFKAVVVVEKTIFWDNIQVEVPMTDEYKQKIETHLEDMKKRKEKEKEEKAKEEEMRKEEEMKENERREKLQKEREKKAKEDAENAKKEASKEKSKSKSAGFITFSSALLSMSMLGSILYQI